MSVRAVRDITERMQALSPHRRAQILRGLKSRFDRTYDFQDYTPEELFKIASDMLVKENLQPTPEAGEHLREYLNYLYDTRDKFFGNARTVRQIIGEAIKNQHLRLASMQPAERTLEVLRTLTLDDVQEFEVKESKGARGSLGFRYGQH